VALTIVLDGDFYAAMHLQPARERDNWSALASAAQRIVAADGIYRSVQILRRNGGVYELRAIRRLKDYGFRPWRNAPSPTSDGQLQLRVNATPEKATTA
jgi:hypothetical protein